MITIADLKEYLDRLDDDIPIVSGRHGARTLR